MQGLPTITYLVHSTRPVIGWYLDLPFSLSLAQTLCANADEDGNSKRDMVHAGNHCIELSQCGRDLQQ
jgi:hypothetical protein